MMQALFHDLPRLPWLIHVRMQLLHSQRVIGLLSSRLAST
jgi:hypothetical protein